LRRLVYGYLKVDNGYAYCLNLLIALDQLLNALLGGACDETLSSRTYRMARRKGGGWRIFEKGVNTLFWFDTDSEGRQHCELAYRVEARRGHVPREFVKAPLASDLGGAT
jgi:uncharacterized protein (DUF58 family)